MSARSRFNGESHRLTLKKRLVYAQSIYKDDSATLDDLREAVTMLENTDRTARRVLGGTNPVTLAIVDNLQQARAKLRAREGAQT